LASRSRVLRDECIPLRVLPTLVGPAEVAVRASKVAVQRHIDEGGEFPHVSSPLFSWLLGQHRDQSGKLITGRISTAPPPSTIGQSPASVTACSRSRASMTMKPRTRSLASA